MDSRQYTVGIVGAGHVVSANHLPALKAMSNIQVSWITDKDLGRAQRVGKSYDVAAFDVATGIQNFPRPDLILLAIPYGVRAPYFEVLARMDSAVYVEKPFARTVAGHHELCRVFPNSKIACGLNRRSWGIVPFCRSVLRSGVFGKVWRAKFGLGTVSGIAAAGLYMADARIAGGGMLIETGVHGVDTVLYCLDAHSAVRQGGNMIVENGHDIHCEGLFSVSTSQGDTVPFEIEVSRLKNTINRVEFEFATCKIHFSLFGDPQLWVESHDGKLRWILSDRNNYYPFTWNQVLLEFWQTFAQGVEENKVNYTSAVESVLTTQVIEDLYALASAETNGVTQ